MATREYFLTTTLSIEQANKLVIVQNAFYHNVVNSYNSNAFISALSSATSIYSVISVLPGATAAGIASLAFSLWEELASMDEDTFKDKANE